MNNLKIFENQEFGKVRVVIMGNEPWFVGKDIAEILKYKEPHKAIVRHIEEDDRMKHPIIDSLGREQETWLINESGIYSLILSSEIPEAKKFKKWITSEVLPTIRKTGGYVANEDVFIATYLPYADEQTKMLFKSTLEIIRKQNETIQLMQPKAEYFDALVDRRLLTNFRDTAKELKIKERDFIQWLLDKRFVYRDVKGELKPYAQYNGKYFEIKEWARNEKAGTQTLITPKGRETFRLLLMKDGLIIAS